MKTKNIMPIVPQEYVKKYNRKKKVEKIEFNNLNEFVQLVQDAMNDSVALEKLRRKEGWRGTHSLNIAQYICKRYGICGFSKQTKEELQKSRH